MAVRGAGPVALAIGMGAGAGAAQLGLGYGLGIIAWLPSADGATEAAWVGSLAWATWIAATSTIAGAVAAGRFGGPPSAPPTGDTALAGTLGRVSLAVAAAVGALVTVALVAVPARAAVRADTFSPQTIAAGYAVVGVVIGLVVAVWALTAEAVAANLALTAGWLWLLAVVAVVDGVTSGRGLGTAQLGVWQMTGGDDVWFGAIYWPGALLTFAAAFAIGVLAARPAARRGDNPVGVVVSGAVGPALVAVAYLLAAPRLVGLRGEQASAYLSAPYAMLAGLAGSVLVAVLDQRARTPRRPGPAPDGDPPPADPTADGTPVADRPVAADQGPDDEEYAAVRSYDGARVPAGAGVEPARARGTAHVPLWPDPPEQPASDRQTFAGRLRRLGRR